MPFFNKSEDSQGRKRGEAPADEDRCFNAGVLAACVLLAATVAGFGIYRVAFNKVSLPPAPRLDLSSLYISGRQPSALPQADAGNPSIAVQEYLEELRTRDYEQAYLRLSPALRDMTSMDAFAANNKRNEPLFREIKRYRFGGYTFDGSAAGVEGSIEYHDGGRSRVKATLVRQAGEWNIALITVAYE
jgi:hypothetical protein